MGTALSRRASAEGSLVPPSTVQLEIPDERHGAPMSTPAVYRFLPFTRRGLVAELRDSTAAAEGSLPVRGAIKLDLTLSGGLGTRSTTTELAGPGDVVGLDPRAIVRLTPKADASNVEPNYL